MAAKEKKLFESGHTACAGCGMAIAIKHFIKTTGKDTVIVNATGCSEIISSNYPRSAFNVPYIHTLFENTASVASGIVHSLRAQGNDHTTVSVIAGDGATYDIGFGALSGMLERNEDVLYLCYDNEAYMNTGIQRSGSTPFGAWTTTSPVGSEIKGKTEFKKPIADIVAAHEIPYVATASIGYLPDFQAKIKKAMTHKGSKFILVYAPCVPGWGLAPNKTVEISRLVVETGLWKMWEQENGERRVTVKPPEPKKPIADYFAMQKRRFKHLSEEQIAQIQAQIDKNWEKEK
ncbi:MAG: thiamine pyrophosphate-dependent enzyme [archaeon]